MMNNEHYGSFYKALINMKITIKIEKYFIVQDAFLIIEQIMNSIVTYTVENPCCARG